VSKIGLTITPTANGPVTILKLTGFLDGHTFVLLERALDQAIKNGARRIAMDLSELGYIASAGVGLFINTQHKLKADGGDLQLASPTANVREIFTILGLDAIFTIHANVDSAVKALNGGK
jgi:anti-sigma B factor antagonist